MPEAVSPEESWSHLGLYLSRDVIERRYRERYERDLDCGKAAEIISHLEQGRQYFRSAENAGVLAGPLEQYYGVLAFARAIVLYRTVGWREANLLRGHGLTAELPPKAPLEEIKLTVTNGTFSELLKATENVELIEIDDAVNWYEGKAPISTLARLRAPEVGSEFNLGDLLARIPEIRVHYEEALQKLAHCHGGRASAILAAVSIHISKERMPLPNPDVLRNRLGLSERWIPHAQPNGVQLDRQLREGASFFEDLPHIVVGRRGDQSLVEPFDGGWALSELCAYFAASHVMSMLVRYYPTRWAKLINHERGDSVLPVLDRVRSLLQTDFVRLALWELERPEPPTT